jgi:hypothetical protein
VVPFVDYGRAWNTCLPTPVRLTLASLGLGPRWGVTVPAPVAILSEAVAPLPQAFVSAAALLPARCAARLSGGRYSGLVVGGPEGLPLDPGGRRNASSTENPHQVCAPSGRDKVFPRLHGGNLASGCSK